MANPFDRSAIEPSGADRRAVGRVGRAKLRMRIFLMPSTKYPHPERERSEQSKDARSTCSSALSRRDNKFTSSKAGMTTKMVLLVWNML
jgi:hypothetical protein